MFTNDFSKKSWVYFLKYNNETLTKFKYFKVEVEKQTSKNIIVFLLDRGGEYLSMEFNNLCNALGIQRQLIQARSPQQNGVA
jgi:transposase InsO family protein